MFACSHKSHHRCFFLFSDAFSRTAHATRRFAATGPVAAATRKTIRGARATNGVVARLFHVRSCFHASRYDTPCVMCVLHWFVDIFIMRRPTVRRTAPIMQTRRSFFFFFYARTRKKKTRALTTQGCAARVEVQYRISKVRYCNASYREIAFTQWIIKYPRISEIVTFSHALRDPV